MICLMIFNECYTHEGAGQGGSGELETQGAVTKLGKKMKVPVKTIQWYALEGCGGGFRIADRKFFALGL